ncbi:MAG: diguanylate cyclase [Chloroflexi bacterium]|nr:diguanylate cyclase [Chloroflexota bacterium]
MVLLVAVAVAYAVAARLSLVFIFEPLNVAGIWPPAGIAVGALLLTSVRRWPLIIGGVAVAVAAANLSAGNPPPMVAGFVLANSLEPLLAATILRHHGGAVLSTVRGVGLFVAFAVLGAPAVGATIGAATAAIVTGAPLAPTWLTWFIGDAGGVMTVAPLLIVAPSIRLWPPMPWRRVAEALVLAASILGLTIISFFPIETAIQLAAYPVFLLLVVIGVRFGTVGAALATASVGSLAMAGTIAGYGPIASLNPGRGVQIGQAQILIAVIFLSSMIIAAAMQERRLAGEGLRVAKDAEADRAGRLARIATFAREITQSLDRDSLFPRIVQAAGEVVPADIVQFTLADDGADTHTVVAAQGAPSVIGRTVESGDGITGAVIRDGLAITHDRTTVSDRARAMSDVMPELEVAITCAPIIIDGSVVATLGLARLDLDRPFDADERGAVRMMSDLAALAVANSLEFGRVHERSIRDVLTGVPNRRYFDLTFEQLSAQRVRQAEAVRPDVSAIIFDLDHFGAVNKERGHATGDAVLAGFGEILAGRLRRADIVARYGGEEFVAVLVGTSRDGALHVAEDIRRRFAETSFIGADGEPIRCTVSAGVASVGPEEESLSGLVSTADVALSMAKRAGRNQVTAA